MKKINFLLAVFLLVVFGIYLFAGDDLNRASSGLVEAYESGDDCSSSGSTTCIGDYLYCCSYNPDTGSITWNSCGMCSTTYLTPTRTPAVDANECGDDGYAYGSTECSTAGGSYDLATCTPSGWVGSDCVDSICEWTYDGGDDSYAYCVYGESYLEEEDDGSGTVTPGVTLVPTSGDEDSCTAVDGVCSSTMALNTCSTSFGVMGIGTSIVSTVEGEVGVLDVWTCNGYCGGSNAFCSVDDCVNGEVINGWCKNGIVGCEGEGILSYNSSDSNNDYINDSNEAEYLWDCLGSTNTCAEGDGTDQLGCTATIDQDAWFQVNDGSILTKGMVVNYVPVTMVDSTSVIASTVVNGGIYSRTISSLSGYDEAVKTESSFNFRTYAYDQIKTDFFDKKGVGSTFAGGADWSTIKNTTGVIFVDGDLEIDSDLVTTNFVMVVAKGTITISPSVDEVDAVLVADTVMAIAAEEDSTESVNQLVINGMVHGVSGVSFGRSLYPKSLNNTSPSVKVNYNPELLFSVPQELAKSFSQWKVL